MEKKQQKQGDQKKQGKRPQQPQGGVQGGGQELSRQEQLEVRSSLESRLYRLASVYTGLLSFMALAFRSETCRWVYLWTVIMVIIAGCIYLYTAYTGYRLYQSCDDLSSFSIVEQRKEERRKKFYTHFVGQVVCSVIFILTIVVSVGPHISGCK